MRLIKARAVMMVGVFWSWQSISWYKLPKGIYLHSHTHTRPFHQNRYNERLSSVSEKNRCPRKFKVWIGCDLFLKLSTANMCTHCLKICTLWLLHVVNDIFQWNVTIAEIDVKGWVSACRVSACKERHYEIVRYYICHGFLLSLF